MKRFLKVAGLLVALLGFGFAAEAQTALTQTSLSAAIGKSDRQFSVASATGITGLGNLGGSVTTVLYIDKEAMAVQSINGTTVNVVRGQYSTGQTAHASGAMVILGPPNAFQVTDPRGACTASATLYTPYINIVAANQWLCSTVTGSWVPGFINGAEVPLQPTTAVASAAGLVTPSGPLFHITGTAAITGFNIPVGFSSGTICAIPDGLFTTTNANNLAIASTAVVSKTLCWTYDSNTAKFYPSY